MPKKQRINFKDLKDYLIQGKIFSESTKRSYQISCFRSCYVHCSECFGHCILEFGIYLSFGALDLRFYRSMKLYDATDIDHILTLPDSLRN